MSAIEELERLREGVVEAQERIRGAELSLRRRRRAEAAAEAEQREHFRLVGAGEAAGNDTGRERELAEAAIAARVPDGASQVVAGAKALAQERAADVERYIVEHLDELVAERADGALAVGRRRREAAEALAVADAAWRAEAGWWWSMLRGAGDDRRARRLLDEMGHDPFHGKVNLGAARQESYPCPWSLAETGDEAA